MEESVARVVSIVLRKSKTTGAFVSKDLPGVPDVLDHWSEKNTMTTMLYAVLTSPK